METYLLIKVYHRDGIEEIVYACRNLVVIQVEMISRVKTNPDLYTYYIRCGGRIIKG